MAEPEPGRTIPPRPLSPTASHTSASRSNSADEHAVGPVVVVADFRPVFLELSAATARDRRSSRPGPRAVRPRRPIFSASTNFGRPPPGRRPRWPSRPRGCRNCCTSAPATNRGPIPGSRPSEPSNKGPAAAATGDSATTSVLSLPGHVRLGRGPGSPSRSVARRQAARRMPRSTAAGIDTAPMLTTSIPCRE